MIQLNPRYETPFKMNHIFHQPSSILPMNVEVDFIKEALDAGLYKKPLRSISNCCSRWWIILWMMSISAILMTCIARSIPCNGYMRTLWNTTLTRNQEGFLKKVIRKYFRVNAIRNMAIQATLKDNLGRVFYSLDEGGYDSPKLSSSSIATLKLEPWILKPANTHYEQSPAFWRPDHLSDGSWPL